MRHGAMYERALRLGDGSGSAVGFLFSHERDRIVGIVWTVHPAHGEDTRKHPGQLMDHVPSLVAWRSYPRSSLHRSEAVSHYLSNSEFAGIIEEC